MKKDIKFDIKSFNKNMNDEIIKNKNKREESMKNKINELNKKTEELEKLKKLNDPYINFFDEMIKNFKSICYDIFNLDIYKIINDDNKLFYLGIWFIIFGLILYVSSYNCNQEYLIKKYINEYLNNKN